MNEFSLNINENNASLYVGNNNVYNICHCGANSMPRLIQEVSSSSHSTLDNGAMANLPRIQLNDNDINVHSYEGDFNSELCLCAVYQQGNKIVVKNPLSRIVADLIHNNDHNCTHFEVQLKVKKTCKICNGNNVETTYNASEEFECTLTIPSLGENKPIQLTRVNYQHELEVKETQFQKFLTMSQNLIKSDGKCIRIITKICENEGKVRIKLRFDVRSSVKRRCKSLSEFDSMKKKLLSATASTTKIPERANSLRNIQRCFSKSNASLGKAQSAITILDGEVNIDDKYDQSGSTKALQETFEKCTEENLDEIDGVNLNELEKQEIFATGKFGPLYKVSRGGRHQLVKVVKTDAENKTFLEEAKKFLKCRHPYVRPTAEIIEREKSSFVFYWFLDGHSLFRAIEDKAIAEYLTYCRILFGIVKGLLYLKRVGIECHYLTPEKVLLDSNFNPRIAGVGKSYFHSPEHSETHGGEFHRSLAYLDVHLRSTKDVHTKNVLWSVGRCIWDMLWGKICLRPGQDLLSECKFFACLENSCDDHTIKTVYFSDKLRKIVYGAGWPRDKEITKSVVICAVRCMLMDLKERISLEDLDKLLENELCEPFKNLRGNSGKFTLYQKRSDNLCLYCFRNEKDNLPLTCGCATACSECLRNKCQLDCPDHGMHYSKIGHPLTYGVIITGEFQENKSVCDNDSMMMENLLNNENIFAIKNLDRVKSRSQNEAREELKKIRNKIMADEKAKDCEKYPRTLLLCITGHCSDAGSLILPDGSILKKKILDEFIRGINVKNLIVLANGYYSEKLVKSLSKAQKNGFSASKKFFGVFSHAGNLCGIQHKDISEENSIFVRFILDIFEKDRCEAGSSTLSSVGKGYLTAAGLTAEISKRMEEKFSKRLIPIDRDGGRIPIAYI